MNSHGSSREDGNSMCYHFTDTNAIGLLAFVGGWVDAAGYLKLQGIFTSSITGNLVAAASIVASTDGVLCRGLVCASFIFSGFLSALVVFRLKDVQKKPVEIIVILLFSVEAIILAITWILGHQYIEQLNAATEANDTSVIIVACVMAASMGVHNVVAKETFVNCPPTTVMTSTMINFSQTLAQAACLKLISIIPGNTSDEVATAAAIKKANTAIEKFIVVARPFVWFVVGAVLGALFMDHCEFLSLVVPICIITVLILSIYQRFTEQTHKKWVDAPEKENVDVELRISVVAGTEQASLGGKLI